MLIKRKFFANGLKVIMKEIYDNENIGKYSKRRNMST